MTNPLDRLNLRPFEKRLVVVVAVVFFVVLNAWLVVPHFSDLGDATKQRADALEKLNRWEVEIAQKTVYERQVKEMETEGGQAVPMEDQQNQFSRTIQMQQAQSGVNVISTSKQTVHTNQFFLELSQQISVQSGEAQLVDFLYNLGSGNSLIRVRDLALHPDPPRQQLSGSVKLVASYQKATPKKGAPAATPPTANAKTLTSNVKRP
jgi:Tfp pilus assembly protein PilO